MPAASRRGYEPKLDGFRCLVCTHGGRFRARSRNGWNMTALLPDLGPALPRDVQLDGELVALDREGRTDFHRLGERILHGRGGIAVMLFVFDVPAVEGLPMTPQPYFGAVGAARRARPRERTGAGGGDVRRR